LPVVFLILLGYSLKRKKQESERLFENGIEYIKLLRSFLTLLQQHRGLTTAFINGSQLVAADINVLNQRISRVIDDIQENGLWVHDNVKWSSMVDHWDRLSMTYIQGDADSNFKQHNIMIANLLYLMEDVADAHHLSRMGAGTLDTDWRYLLSIAEYIGQARALGTGVAAKGECSSVMRIQLNHLCHKIAGSIEVAWPEKSRQEIKNFLACIESQLMIENPCISATDYFTLATHCIDQVLEQFDRQIDNLQFYRS
jgi:hypothetical protein